MARAGAVGLQQKGRKIRNNVLYRVVSLGFDEVVVLSEADERIALSYVQTAELLRLSFARTYASCQGTEFEGTLRLHDTTNKHFTKKHLFVALSRGRRAEDIHVE